LEIVGGEASQLNDFCFRKLCSDNRGLSGIFDEVGRRKLALYLSMVVQQSPNHSTCEQYDSRVQTLPTNVNIAAGLQQNQIQQNQMLLQQGKVHRGLSGIFDEVGRRKLALYLSMVVDVEAV
jgi:hypothetical protein